MIPKHPSRPALLPPAGRRTCLLTGLIVGLIASLRPTPASAQHPQPTQPAQQDTADALFDQGHYLRALPLIQANLQQNPTDIHALVKASEIQWAFYHEDLSLALAEKAVALAPNSPAAHTQLTNALGTKLMSNNSSTFEKLSAARRFRKEVEHALQLNPNHPDTIEDAAQFYWNAPTFVGGDHAKAQQLADRLVAIDPARAANLKATFAADDKDPVHRSATILALWKQALAARPHSYDAHIGLGNAYLNATPTTPNNLHLAETEAQQALAIDPTRIPAYRLLAILYTTTARWSDLDAILQRARTAVPDDLSPYFQAANTILNQNLATQFPRARQYLQAYLAQPAEGQAPTHEAARQHLSRLQ